jgi:hypothetical protein
MDQRPDVSINTYSVAIPRRKLLTIVGTATFTLASALVLSGCNNGGAGSGQNGNAGDESERRQNAKGDMSKH